MKKATDTAAAKADEHNNAVKQHAEIIKITNPTTSSNGTHVVGVDQLLGNLANFGPNTGGVDTVLSTLAQYGSTVPNKN